VVATELGIGQDDLTHREPGRPWTERLVVVEPHVDESPLDMGCVHVDQLGRETVVVGHMVGRVEPFTVTHARGQIAEHLGRVPEIDPSDDELRVVPAGEADRVDPVAATAAVDGHERPTRATDQPVDVEEDIVHVRPVAHHAHRWPCVVSSAAASGGTSDSSP
jgi:hypothetical protein